MSILSIALIDRFMINIYFYLLYEIKKTQLNRKITANIPFTTLIQTRNSIATNFSEEHEITSLMCSKSNGNITGLKFSAKTETSIAINCQNIDYYSNKTNLSQ